MSFLTRVKNKYIISAGENRKTVDPCILAGISDIVYHYTQLFYAAQILKEDQFALTFISGADDTLKPNDKYYYLSTTRSRRGRYHEGSRFHALMVLDGTKLRHNYIGSPVDYWGREFRKVAPAKNEMEDRIWSDKPYIKPASKYIKEIHIAFVDVKQYLGHAEFGILKRQLRYLLTEAKKKGIPIFVYTDETAAKNLDKRKAVKLADLDLKTEVVEPSKSNRRRDDMAVWLELYEKDNVDHLSTEPYGGAKRRLNTLCAFDGIESFKADVHNSKRGGPALHKIVEILKINKWDMKAFFKHLQDKWKFTPAPLEMRRLV